MPDVVNNIDWFVELGILNVVDDVVNNIDGKVELGVLNVVDDVVNNIDGMVELGVLNIVDDDVNSIDGKVELGILNVVDDVVNNIDGIVAFNAVNKLHVKFPLTFNELWHVIDCDIFFKTTVVWPEAFATKPKSDAGDVKNPAVLIDNLFDESTVNVLL